MSRVDGVQTGLHSVAATPPLKRTPAAHVQKRAVVVHLVDAHRARAAVVRPRRLEVVADVAPGQALRRQRGAVRRRRDRAEPPRPLVLRAPRHGALRSKFFNTRVKCSRIEEEDATVHAPRPGLRPACPTSCPAPPLAPEDPRGDTRVQLGHGGASRVDWPEEGAPYLSLFKVRAPPALLPRPGSTSRPTRAPPRARRRRPRRRPRSTPCPTCSPGARGPRPRRGAPGSRR